MSLALLLGSQLQAFVEAGMEVIGASAPGPWVSDLEKWGVRHVPLTHATRAFAPTQDARAMAELVAVFRQLRPDIVHTHNPKPGLYGRCGARIARIPAVVNTVHGLYATPADSLRRRIPVYVLERIASTWSHVELVQNVEDMAVLERIGVPGGKLVHLGNGVDLKRFVPPTDSQRNRARQTLGFGPHQVVVGTVGRLVWEKGFRELFAAARLLRRRQEVVFVVVGPLDGDKADALTPADIERARGSGNIVFLGERRDVEELYRSFDVLAQPSYREGMPRSAMEAAATGLPVVASDVRGSRQVVDQGVTGLLVPAHDAGALAKAIERLADHPDDRRVMGDAARLRAVAEFDDRRIVATTIEVYERLTGGRPPTRFRQKLAYR